MMQHTALQRLHSTPGLSRPLATTLLPASQSHRHCHRRHCCSAQAKQDPQLISKAGSWDRKQLLDQTVAMFAAGATLGPLCDSLHSSGNVLHYTHPSINNLGPLQLETCWWVPLLFGCAGLILGVSYPVLDDLDAVRRQADLRSNSPDGAGASSSSLTPSWPTTILCISLFVVQYKLSAILDQELLGYHGAADVVLLAYGLAVWRALDNTAQGLAMSLLTAAAGPAVEVFLINVLGLYHYQHPQVLGVPTWIPWVYFCGGPAVGLLGRRVWATLSSKRAQCGAAG